MSDARIAWCRGQQIAALSHMRPAVVSVGHGAALIPHRCDHPQCIPALVRLWCSDCFFEELEIEIQAENRAFSAQNKG